MMKGSTCVLVLGPRIENSLVWKSVYCWYLNYNKNEWSLVNVSDIATCMNEIGFQKITNVPRSSAPKNIFLFLCEQTVLSSVNAISK